MVEFVVLAVGPKHCDFEVKELYKGKTVGRVQFDVNVQQLQTMQICMEELHLSITGQEERPLYSQFRVISNKEVPKLSEHSQTMKGRFKKETNETKFKWELKKDTIIGDLPESLDESKKGMGLAVNQEISLESMKNSTIQLLIKVDTNFSEVVTERIITRLFSQSMMRATELEAWIKQRESEDTPSNG